MGSEFVLASKAVEKHRPTAISTVNDFASDLIALVSGVAYLAALDMAPAFLSSQSGRAGAIRPWRA